MLLFSGICPCQILEIDINASIVDFLVWLCVYLHENVIGCWYDARWQISAERLIDWLYWPKLSHLNSPTVNVIGCWWWFEDQLSWVVRVRQVFLISMESGYWFVHCLRLIAVCYLLSLSLVYWSQGILNAVISSELWFGSLNHT